MKTYATPYRDAALDDLSTSWSSDIYYLIHADSRASLAMSESAHEGVARVLSKFFKRRGFMSHRLRIGDGEIYTAISTADDLVADYRVSLRDLVLSAAAHSEDYDELPRSALSSMLRNLADEIDAMKKQA